MIGRHYNYDNYNCAHFVKDYYSEKLNIEIPVMNVFGLGFLRWLRHRFEQVQFPVEHCIVRMTKNGESHVGVYADYGVYHNYKPLRGTGAVVHWDLGVIKRHYDKVEFWKWSQ